MTDETKPKKVIYPLIANPPHTGTYLELAALGQHFNIVYVIIPTKLMLLNNEQCVKMIDMILNPKDKDLVLPQKFVFVYSGIDWKNCNKLTPELLELDTQMIATSNDEVYANLIAKGYPYANKIPKPLGWNDAFEQVAYLRGYALDKVRYQILRTSKRL